MPSLFQRLGEPTLRAIVNDFIDRCYDDTIIGFLFTRAERDRIKRFEYQHAANFLGAEVEYGGRTLRDAHAAHRILGGQFDRRRQILVETLQFHDVPQDIVSAWLAHQDGLRAQITADPDSNCRD